MCNFCFCQLEFSHIISRYNSEVSFPNVLFIWGTLSWRRREFKSRDKDISLHPEAATAQHMSLIHLKLSCSRGLREEKKCRAALTRQLHVQKSQPYLQQGSTSETFGHTAAGWDASKLPVPQEVLKFQPCSSKCPWSEFLLERDSVKNLGLQQPHFFFQSTLMT